MIHILIVSADPLRAKVIALALRNPSLAVRCIDPARCVIQECQNWQVDLVIFLTLTPYFASMNIVDEMRKKIDRVPQIYVIAQSHSQSTILTLLECGVDQYMTFPLNLHRLRNKVYSLAH
ncbi:MAG: DNA-binding response regulator [Rikenellaceae bacterium]